jgi:hypothetical protein
MAILDRVQAFVDASNSTNSNTDKLNVIKEFSQDAEVMKMLRYVYHPTKQFYVTSEGCKKRSELISYGYKDIFTLLDDLATRFITGHTAIAAVNGFVSVNPRHADLIWNILDRNLKTRSTTSMINKIVPGLIPTFDVALAKAYDEKTQKKVNWKDGWYMSRKIDGCLHGDTIIEFKDGRKLKIREVVDKKINGSVKSYNVQTKKIEYKPIKDWMVNLQDVNQDNNEWFEIELENGAKVILTGNHRVWLPELKCWRRTDELIGGEILLIN